jgi:hypothetical protein
MPLVHARSVFYFNTVHIYHNNQFLKGNNLHHCKEDLYFLGSKCEHKLIKICFKNLCVEHWSRRRWSRSRIALPPFALGK